MTPTFQDETEGQARFSFHKAREGSRDFPLGCPVPGREGMWGRGSPTRESPGGRLGWSGAAKTCPPPAHAECRGLSGPQDSVLHASPGQAGPFPLGEWAAPQTAPGQSIPPGEPVLGGACGRGGVGPMGGVPHVGRPPGGPPAHLTPQEGLKGAQEWLDCPL